MKKKLNLKGIICNICNSEPTWELVIYAHIHFMVLASFNFAFLSNANCQTNKPHYIYYIQFYAPNLFFFLLEGKHEIF